MRIFILLAILSFSFTNKKKETTVAFNITFHGSPLVLGKTYYNPQTKDSVRIDKLMFYVSQPTLHGKKGKLKAKVISHQLIDLSKPNSLSLQFLQKKEVAAEKISFVLGVDSNTNSSGAHGGDLDPTNGMYWAWQSGYIHFKLEGYAPSCPARNNMFQYHIGGFLSPFNSIQTIELDIRKSNTIELKLENLLDEIATNYEIMSPSEESVLFAKKIARNIIIGQ